jgi:hypothetical protein
MPNRRVKERRKRAHEFKRLIQVHGGRKKQPAATYMGRTRNEEGGLNFILSVMVPVAILTSYE